MDYNQKKEVLIMFELEIKGGNVVKIYKRKDEKAIMISSQWLIY